MHLNLGSILSANANEKPEALVLRAGELELSYGELDRAARGVAASLSDRGIVPGDKVDQFLVDGPVARHLIRPVRHVGSPPMIGDLPPRFGDQQHPRRHIVAMDLPLEAGYQRAMASRVLADRKNKGKSRPPNSHGNQRPHLVKTSGAREVSTTEEARPVCSP